MTTEKSAENEQYLKENGLPDELDIFEGNIGEWIGEGVFRNLLEPTSAYGVYSQAVAQELVRCFNNRKNERLIEDIRRLCRLVNEPVCACPESPRAVLTKCLEKLEKRATELQLLTHENHEKTDFLYQDDGVIGFSVKMSDPVYFTAEEQ